ncbi:ParA family protein [Facilibium subflavum]|uniref:ParA family protein n=1 Tax=Facilibium subflavum TaxID=2219058 RepID=UPI000E652D69|nr:ParA family protein [Facilibium subflavum]
MKKAKIIALLQQKGGSGKTTTAMNIAGGLRELGYRVLVIDMDKDKPDAWSWAAKSEDFSGSVIQVDEKTAREKIAEIRSQADFIIIDTPPNFQTAALKAALLSDMVIIPAAPSGMDLSGLLEAKDLALTADRPYRLLANRVLKTSNMSRSLLSVLEEEGQAFSTYIPQSVKFVEAEAAGLYIGEYAPQSTVHIQVKKLSREIVELFEKVVA